jgi:hypothetical protein
MHPDYPPRQTMRELLEHNLREIQEALRDPCLDELVADDLVLERLPNGELGWLRPDTRYVLTPAGRADLAS